MSPGQTRAFFAGFVLIAVATAGNALWQAPRAGADVAVARTAPVRAVEVASAPKPSAPPPAAAFAAAPVKVAEATPPAAPVVRTAKVIPDAAIAVPMPLAPATDADAETVRTVQRELVNRGYGPLVVNGTVGPLTRAAIMGFEFDQGLGLSGEASAALLKRLTSASAPAAARPADPQARKIRTAEAEQVVRTVQHSLTTLGYQPGTIDGRLGGETERAIRLFESDIGQAPTGRVSAELFSQLARGVGAKSSAGR